MIRLKYKKEKEHYAQTSWNDQKDQKEKAEKSHEKEAKAEEEGEITSANLGIHSINVVSKFSQLRSASSPPAHQPFQRLLSYFWRFQFGP